MYVGDSPQRFQACGTFDNGQLIEVTAKAVWAMTDPQVATVSNAAGAMGLVTPVKVGTTVLRATVGDVTGSTTLSVAPGDQRSAATAVPGFPAMGRRMRNTVPAPGWL
jgi:hypothetical protein